ncbi:MAG: hypothetical protein IPM32_10900 [Ignavibacteriae bacterium]|nr:hypothetical protein [Ignavibacteriota bacterium]
MSWYKIKITEKEFTKSGHGFIFRDLDDCIKHNPKLKNVFFAVKEHIYGEGHFYYFCNPPQDCILSHLLSLGASVCDQPNDSSGLHHCYASFELYQEYFDNLSDQDTRKESSE